MNAKRFSPLAVVIFTGCHAVMVQTRPVARGPVPGVVIDAGGGEIKYATQGLGWAVTKRREDALAQMDKYCGGAKSYSIIDEVEREDAEAGFRNEGDVVENLSEKAKHYETDRYQHIYFECSKR